MSYEYDMVVVGGGAAGLTAAGMSALLGAKTALVEERRLGGDCTWVGCVPSKSLLRASRAAHTIRTADRFGLRASEPKFSFSEVMDHIHRTREHIYRDSDAPPQMEKLGVELVFGRAQFSDAHSVEVQARGSIRRLTSRFFVIATGSRPRTGEFAAEPLTNETIFELEQQPEHLVVMGAGPVGIEMAQAFRRLGSQVTVVASGDSILPRDDAEHARQLQVILEREGVVFVLGGQVKKVERQQGRLTCGLENGKTLICDAALASLGRVVTIKGLHLEKAGVRYSARGIAVNAFCRTSQWNVYAVGDVTGQYQFTHMAEHMSKVAVSNAILRRGMRIDSKHVVWCTYTEPELAHLGRLERELHEQKQQFAGYRFPFAKLDRAITDGETEGEVKVLASRRGKILGVSILGVNAGELICEYALAMRHGLSLSKIAGTIHPYPTYAMGNRRVADQFVARHLDSPWLGVLDHVLGYRGRRQGSKAL